MMKIAAILTSAAIACAPVACPVQENFAARCAADRIDCVQNVCMSCPTQNACSGYDDLFDVPAQVPSESQQPDDSGSESARLNEYARQVIDLVNQERAGGSPMQRFALPHRCVRRRLRSPSRTLALTAQTVSPFSRNGGLSMSPAGRTSPRAPSRPGASWRAG